MTRGYLSEDPTTPEESAPKKKRNRKKKSGESTEHPIIGVDGEGHDVRCGACNACVAFLVEPETAPGCTAADHIYTYLAAVDEFGTLVAEAYNPKGLSLVECSRMLLSLPKESLKFGFMFSYDVTKIVQDLPPVDRYYLMRPKLRDETICPECRIVFPPRTMSCEGCGGEVRGYTRKVRFDRHGYDYFNGSFSIAKGRKNVKIWDCFRFFGCAFVQALKDWSMDKSGVHVGDVATLEQIERISAMKQKRGALEKESVDDVKNYCREECWLLAKMMRKVIRAHDEAGIPLTRYEGAGSTATALLRANEVATFKGPGHRAITEEDAGLANAMACSFFGGRFEDSVVGYVPKPVFGFDISSAYPFAQTFLPCLSCGSWRLERNITPRKLARVQLAVAEFRVRPLSEEAREATAWCPLPFRDDKGSIAYGTNFSGWAWSTELLASLEGWPDLVELTGHAYVYETSCTHKPFGYVPPIYRKRTEWGKDGPGIALKLGLNAGYGKTAQSIGEDPPFQSWVWAGVTTAEARAQILRAIASAHDRWNVLTIATDGIYALEDLPIRDPARDTGTSDLKKPLGGWERKEIPEGIFVAKPGLYYRLNPELSDVRARGVGRKEIFTSRARLEQGFRDWDRADTEYGVLMTSRRFYGAKHAIFAHSKCGECGRSWPGVPERGCQTCRKVGTEFKTSMTKLEDGREAYGTWGLREVRVGFDPYPKRERDGISREGDYAKLCVRDLGGMRSAAYDVGGGTTSPEGMLSRLAKDDQLEQPDWDEEI